MPKEQLKRLSSAVLEADRGIFAALQGIEGYAPVNQTYSLAAITAKQTGVAKAQSDEAQAASVLAAAREDAIEKEIELHNLLLGAKTQVMAQFGEDSHEVEALGLKRKSEYRSPTRRRKVSSVTQ